MRVLIAGGSAAGMLAALVLARAGHTLTLVERDEAPAATDLQEVVNEPRAGVPHQFLPRGRKELAALLPDVMSRLVNNGAHPVDVARKLQGPRQPRDDDLVHLWLRRPLLEWALRQAVAAQPGIQVRRGAKVSGLRFRGGAQTRVTGLCLASGEELDADLTLDTMGRGTPVPAWLAAQGVQVPTRTAPSGFVSFARYYRFRPGAVFPDGPWPVLPMGRLGYAEYRVMPGDNGTFCALLHIPDWDHDLRALHQEWAFEAAVRTIPVARDIVEAGEPVVPVGAMGQLPNTLRWYAQDGRALVPGLLAVGDSLSHTDPSFSLGLSMAVLQAKALADALEAEGADLDAVAAGFHARVMPELEERYHLTATLNDVRTRIWRGETLEFRRAGGHYPAFCLYGVGLVALQDDAILRKFSRRNGFLDRTKVFDEDAALHARIEALIDQRLASGTPAPHGPARDELLAVLRQAAPVTA